jgi:hypothetical protein
MIRFLIIRWLQFARALLKEGLSERGLIRKRAYQKEGSSERGLIRKRAYQKENLSGISGERFA